LEKTKNLQLDPLTKGALLLAPNQITITVSMSLVFAKTSWVHSHGSTQKKRIEYSE
jgi:hypothetical protein